MSATFLILFREVLEMALILGIIMAATRGVAGRMRWIGLGLLGGLLGSLAIAISADRISEAMEGMGQEMFNGGILLAASFMIGWTVVWMKKHGRELAQKMKQVGQAVKDGEMPLYSVSVVVALSMWREGAEIVLFMTGVLATTEESLLAIMMAGIAGAACAGMLGALIYLGLIQLSSKHMFTVTGWLLVLVACGMAAQSAAFFSAAGALPELANPLWDTSWLLSDESWLGSALKPLIGYTAQPTGMQALWYAAAFCLIAVAMKLSSRPAVSQRPAAA